MGLDTKTYWLTDCQSQWDFHQVSSYPTRVGVSAASKNEEPGRSTENSGARVTVEEETSEGALSANNCISECKDWLLEWILER
jgi:hypothetical protein